MPDSGKGAQSKEQTSKDDTVVVKEIKEIMGSNTKDTKTNTERAKKTVQKPSKENAKTAPKDQSNKMTAHPPASQSHSAAKKAAASQALPSKHPTTTPKKHHGKEDGKDEIINSLYAPTLR